MYFCVTMLFFNATSRHKRNGQRFRGHRTNQTTGAEDPPPPPEEEADIEEILESAQSVRPKETSAGLTAELHSEKNTLLII